MEPEAQQSKQTQRELLLTSLHVVVVLIGLLICFGAYRMGILYNVLWILLVVLAIAVTTSRLWGLFRKDLELRFLRHPFQKDLRKYLFQCLNHWAFFGLLAGTLSLAMIPAQFSVQQYRVIQVMLWGASGVLMGLALIPYKTVRISTNSFFVVGGLFLGLELLRIVGPWSDTAGVVIDAPVRGEWYIMQGGTVS